MTVLQKLTLFLLGLGIGLFWIFGGLELAWLKTLLLALYLGLWALLWPTGRSLEDDETDAHGR